MSAESAASQPDSSSRDPSSLTPLDTADADAGAKRDAARINTGQESRDAAASDQVDAGMDSAAPPASGTTPEMTETQDAGVTTPPDSSAPDTIETPARSVPAECTRDALRTNADAYLQAMTAGDPSSLRLHSAVRYTENGQEQQLGAGVWRRGAQVDFSRHVFDELRCSSITQAVLSSLLGPVSFGVRLLYREGELLEVEAHVVPDTLAQVDVNTIIPIGNDRLVDTVVAERRMSRAQLEAYADRYFDAAANGGEVPPSAPDCRRRQNGVPIGDGLCNRPPGVMRFEQRRYPVIDEEVGIITASVIYDNYLGLYLIKMAGDTVLSIEVVGGARTASSGW